MNKNSNMFKPNIGDVNNNEKVYYSFLDDKLNVNNDKENFNDEEPIDFINRLNRESKYIFNRKVVIETRDNNRYDTKIAGKIGNRIVTLDNKSINIDDIVRIYEK